MPEDIDRTRTEALAKKLFETVCPTLAATPYGRDNVYAVLNAVAWVAAAILAGAADRDALDFFELALKQNLTELGG